MKKILVPSDFSEKADFALEAACEIARRSEAQVILLHVVESASNVATAFTGEIALESSEENLFTMKLIDRAKEEIAIRKADPSFYGDNWISEIQVGNAFHGIKNIVSEYEVDLIVMGTSGHNGFDEMLMGSTAEKVVRYAKCPVLTIHKKQENFDYKNIVFATTMRPEESHCLELAKRMQAVYNAKLHLVRINTPNNFERDVDSLIAMQEYALKSDLINFELHVFNDVTEEDGIIYFADHIDSDLIILPTHGRTGLAHLLSGSIAEEVVSQANRPVLTEVMPK